MSHPNSLDLEAFACGEEVSLVAGHLDACEACRAFVEKLRGLPIPKLELPSAKKSNLYAIGVPLAMAAAILLFLKSRKPEELVAPAPVAQSTATEEPTTSFKGVRQVAVIRERNGEQKRFTGHVPVQEGDRLRIEVAIDREQTILAGVLSEDGSFLELMPAVSRPAGTHYSEKSARVSAPPSDGTILVGTEAEIARARQHQATTDVDSIHVEWEPSR
jgi:hypothetical protein